MNKKTFFLFIFIFFLLPNCSFDNKTGIWGDEEKEILRLDELAKRQKQIINVEKVYSSENTNLNEKYLKKNIVLSKPRINSSWLSSSLNNQNLLGNLSLQDSNNLYLKKSIGKNKFPILNFKSQPIVKNSSIFFSDDSGTIFCINENGKIKWKRNVYKKLYKKIYKKLSFSIYGNNIFVADNIGFVYSVNIDNGEIFWIKNYYIPFKSHIKIFDKKIYLLDQDNKILCLDANDGEKIWDILSIQSFIKTQNFLSIAISKQGDLLAINSASDLIKANGKTGNIYWSSNISNTALATGTDFFESSELVLLNNTVFISSSQTTYSYKLENGYLNWESKVGCTGTPVIDKKNLFCVTKKGFFVILDITSGEIISSTNIISILKEKKRNTYIVGYVMGSGKIYSLTNNGYLIVSSAKTGKVEVFKKIGDSFISPPIIVNNKLFVLTKNSKILGFN